MRRNYIIILCAALIATLPLIAGGCSCGHDFDFHLQSWLDAAEQLRHGTLLPHWTFSAAYDAGEPRFIFYPPLSWMLGALLTLVFPFTAVATIYTFIVLAAAGLAMHRLASHFAAPNAALVAAVLYVANPYMLFNAFERTAYAEMLAAAWLPLLLLAVLRERPTVRSIALPVALLWLTNAPAAVMGCYTLALVVVVRIVIVRREIAETRSGGAARLATTALAGTALGLALPAFYLVPAAYEQRFVQIAMAIIPNMRFQDNFLFGHTGDGPHDNVLHTASLLAVTLLAATAVTLAGLLLRRHFSSQANGEVRASTGTIACLGLLAFGIGFLLTPLSMPVWRYLPELAFLQFQWRLLSVLAVVLMLAVALLLRGRSMRGWIAAGVSLVLAAALTFFSIHEFRQGCDDTDLPASREQAFRAHLGVEPTDEYTPRQADNDALRADDPPFWLATDSAAFAPNTMPHPAAGPTFGNAAGGGASGLTPQHFTFHLAQPATLVLNLRDYPNWEVSGMDANGVRLDHPYHIPRDDGLIAIPLYHPSDYTIDIRWRYTYDQQFGIGLSGFSIGVYAALMWRSRRIEV